MDGIVSGLTSIVPFLSDQTIITDRSGANKPPVEIMPLPTNSFMSEDSTAELLNNPYTLSLDIQGHNDGDANDRKAVGRGASQAGSTTPADDAAAEALLNHAYTLSLGKEENLPIAAEIAREMSRMKNYEMLGKNATRQIYRMNPETGAAEHVAVETLDSTSGELISEKVRSMLSQSGLLSQTRLPMQDAAQQNGDSKTVLAQMLGRTTTSPELLPEEATNIPRAAQPGSYTATPNLRHDISLLSNLTGVQLSASDIETIMALEPDLQEAMLNMMSTANTNRADAMATNMPSALPYNDIADETNAGNNIQNRQGAILENNPALIDNNQFMNAQQSGINMQTLADISRLPQAAQIKQLAVGPDGAQIIAMTEEELAVLTTDALTGGKAFGALTTNTLRGSMANLQKVNELPYALYLFGNIRPDSMGVFEEAGDIAISEEADGRKARPFEFLRISEAIKMASVLHNIYYGGSGQFPQETPWYGPYVRYAIKNGIINSGEFSDYNEPATRAETAYIFTGSVPKAELPSINFISGIPNVTQTIKYADSIYLLFRAGILTKNAKQGVFEPESMITKTEAASIIGRIATPGDRKLFRI